MKYFTIAMILNLYIFSPAHGDKGDGTGTSNGGDEIRATFIRKGFEIVQFLQTTERGQKILADGQLDLTRIQTSLDVYKIQVVPGPLIDSTGSVVDAIGIPGFIRLDQQKWPVLFASSKDIYYLVFHEMLRSASYNDDNYIISFAINPFPTAQNQAPITGDFSKMIFQGMSYDGQKFESFAMQKASAVVYRSRVDSELKLSFGFLEFEHHADPCDGGPEEIEPSEQNPKQRNMMIADLSLVLGMKQQVKPVEGSLLLAHTPNGRVISFDYAAQKTHYHTGAFGEVTILALSDTQVTVEIDHFQSTSNTDPFQMNGTATIKICTNK